MEIAGGRPTADIARESPMVEELVQSLGRRSSSLSTTLPPTIALQGLAVWLREEAYPRGPDCASLVADTINGLRVLLDGPYPVQVRDATQDLISALEAGSTEFAFRAARENLLQQTEAMTQLVTSNSALASTWNEVVRVHQDPAAAPEDLAEQVAVLRSSCEAGGRDWNHLSRLLLGVLADSARGIAEVVEPRGDLSPLAPRASPAERAGLTVPERLQLCVDILTRPPESGDCVLWLAFYNAQVDPLQLPIGPVTFIEGQWWDSVMKHSPDHQGLPEEIRADLLASRHLFDGLPESSRYVLARIELGEQLLSDAVARGQANIRALVQLADFRGRSSWIEMHGYVLFVNGQWERNGFFAIPVSPATTELVQDDTRRQLRQLQPMIGPHLPISDPRLQQATASLAWLSDARRSESAAKLVLSLRIVEQVARWAAGAQVAWYKFAADYLRHGWSYQQLLRELTDAVLPAVYEIDQVNREDFLWVLSDLRLEHEGLTRVVDRARCIPRIPWLLDRLPVASRARRPLAVVGRRLGSGNAAVERLDVLALEFDVLLARARRCRNAIAHGNPLEQGVLERSGDFAYWLGAQSLYDTLDGLLLEDALDRHFELLEAHHLDSLTALRAGGSPSECLFWSR